MEKQKREGRNSITSADRRRWELPKTAWQEWEVPFDTDPDWPKPLRDALTAYRDAWRAKRDEVNGCIAANADIEELVDKPEIVDASLRFPAFLSPTMLTRRMRLGRPDPKYFRLWRNISDNLKPHERVGKRPKPEAIYLHAEGALKTLAAQWKKRFDQIARTRTADTSSRP